MKLRRYLEKNQPDNSVCLMSIMNIKFKKCQEDLDQKPQPRPPKREAKPSQIQNQNVKAFNLMREVYDFSNNVEVLFLSKNQARRPMEKEKIAQDNSITANIQSSSNTAQIKSTDKAGPLPLIEIQSKSRFDTIAREKEKLKSSSDKEKLGSNLSKMPNIIAINRIPEVHSNANLRPLKDIKEFSLPNSSMLSHSVNKTNLNCYNFKSIFRSPSSSSPIREVPVTENPKTKIGTLNNGSASSLNKEIKFKFYFNSKGDKVIFNNLMKHRVNWERAESKNSSINFLWKYSNRSKFFKTLNYSKGGNLAQIKVFNHFEFHTELTNKKSLFINLIKYCNQNGLNPFSFIPFTIILTREGGQPSDFHNNLKNFKEVFEDMVDFRAKNAVKSYQLDQYSKHFNLPIKETLYNKIKVYVPDDFLQEKNYWIIKPDNLCQGKLIQIFENPDELIKSTRTYFQGIDDKKVKSKQESLKLPSQSCNPKLVETTKQQNSEAAPKKKGNSRKYVLNNLILQKYIEKPFLFNNRKFDLRVFVLLDHLLNLYMFEEGHLKTSTEDYDIQSKELFIHITNYSLQKKNPNFQKFEKGNEVSFKDFQTLLDSLKIAKSIKEDIMPKIKDIIKISFLSVGSQLNKNNAAYTFEIYGCDLILDSQFNPYLLEINDNPGLSISSPIIEKIVPRMLDDAFRLTLDKIFPTIYSEEVGCGSNDYESPFTFEGYSGDHNMFEFICNIK